METASAPAARMDYGIAYDAAREVVVLFGGLDQENNPLGDTWTWDGSDWSKEQPGNSPNPEFYGVLGYDETQQQAVLWGFGFNETQPETWAWNGLTWTQINTGDDPGPVDLTVAEGSIVYDTRLRQLLLITPIGDRFTGFVQSIWVWTGSGWEMFNPHMRLL